MQLGPDQHKEIINVTREVSVPEHVYTAHSLPNRMRLRLPSLVSLVNNRLISTCAACGTLPASLQLAEVCVEQPPEDGREVVGEGVQPATGLGAEGGLHRPAVVSSQ